MASCIQIDGKEKMKRLILHLKSSPHMQGVAVQKNYELWKTHSHDHPWIAVLRKQDTAVATMLTRLAVDVYNDSLMSTFPARNRPARSLAQMKADHVLAAVSDNGWEVDLQPFSPPNSALHYRDPVAYRDTVDLVASLEVEKLTSKITNSVCCAIQIDGSVNRQQVDNKFVCA